MKLVKVTKWLVPDPVIDYCIATDMFCDGCYGHFGDDEDYEGNHPERVYEIVDGAKVPLNAHYEAYWKNGLLASKGTFIDGLRQGFWQDYNENGNIDARGIIIDNRSVGRWQFYDENGQSMKPSGMK